MNKEEQIQIWQTQRLNFDICRRRRQVLQGGIKMTDRYSGFIVVLEKDLRQDDAEDTIKAIKQIKGVLRVAPQISDYALLAAYSRARQELIERLWKVLEESK